MSKKRSVGSQRPEAVSSVREVLDKATYYFDECRRNYHDPREFIFSLNTLIQDLRNITFRVQANKKELSDFEQWYEPWQSLLRANSTAKWAIEARNRVVKKEGLAPSSRATVTLVNSYLCPFKTSLSLPPCLTTQQAVSVVAESTPAEQLEGSTLIVERHWEVDTLPDQEILAALRELLHIMVLLVLDFEARVAGKATPPPGEIVKAIPNSCPALTEDDYQIVVDPTTFEEKGLVTRDAPNCLEDPDFKQKVVKRYGTSRMSHTDNPDDPLEFARALLPQARHLMRTDGYHTTLLWLHHPEKSWQMISTYFGNQTDKYFFWHEVAKEVAAEGVDGLVFMSEAWTQQLDRWDRMGQPLPLAKKSSAGEGLVVWAASADGRLLYLFTPVRRFLGLTLLGETVEEETGLPGFISPIRRVWGYSY